MLGRHRPSAPTPASAPSADLAPASGVAAPGSRTPGPAWLALGVVIGCFLSVAVDFRASQPAIPVSTLVARAAAELRCECPPPPACSTAASASGGCPVPPACPPAVPVPLPRELSPAATVGWTDPWWKDTAGKYGIVVIEPRLHPALIFIITDTLSKIPPTWNAIVFFSAKTEKFLRLALEPWVKIGRVTLTPFPAGNDGSYMFSNDMLLRPALYELVPFEKFLIIHTDSLICHKNWDALGKFVEYDYIGSPWRDLAVGNGGFSWRNRDLSLKIVKDTNPPLRDFPEDWYMAKHTTKYGGKVAPWSVAKYFGMETVWFEEPWGLHAAWHYHKNWTLIDCEGIDIMGRLHLDAQGVQVPNSVC